jgi:hypothetical protein
MKIFTAIVFLTISILAHAENSNESVFDKKQKITQEGLELYSSNSEMKTYKKFGLGVSLGTTTGLLGLNGEINLDRYEALALGLGAGPSYGTFSLGWKHNFEAQYLSPYSKVGYSKWFNSSGKNATDSDVLKRIFTDEELRSGKFNADFIFGGMGIEYNQLEGDLAGVNLFGEVIMLSEISKSTFIPTGGIGIIYYY